MTTQVFLDHILNVLIYFCTAVQLIFGTLEDAYDSQQWRTDDHSGTGEKSKQNDELRARKLLGRVSNFTDCE